MKKQVTIQARNNALVKVITAKFNIQCKGEIKVFERKLQYIEITIVNGNRFEVLEHIGKNFDKTYSIIIIDEWTEDVIALAESNGARKSPAKINGFNGQVIKPATYSTFDFLMPQDCGFKLNTLGIVGHDNRDYADLVQAAFFELKYEH